MVDLILRGIQEAGRNSLLNTFRPASVSRWDLTECKLYFCRALKCARIVTLPCDCHKFETFRDF